MQKEEFKELQHFYRATFLSCNERIPHMKLQITRMLNINHITLFLHKTLDIEKPTINNFPNNTYLEAEKNKRYITVNWDEPKAADNSGHITLISTHQSGYQFPTGQTDVTYIAFDSSKNQVSMTFSIFIQGMQTFNT